MKSIASEFPTLTGEERVSKRPRNLISGNDGSLEVSLPIQSTARDTIVQTFVPVINNFANYGIISDQLYDIFTSGGGSVFAEGNLLSCIIGSTIGAYSVVRSRRVLKSRPGIDIQCIISAAFNPITLNQLQFIGLGNAGSDAYFCTNPTTGKFAVRFSTGGLVDVYTLTITAAASATTTGTLILCNDSVTVNFTNASGNLNFSAHQIETSCIANATFASKWFIEHIGATIIFSYKGAGLHTGTVSWTPGVNAAAGNLVQTQEGAPLDTTYVELGNHNGTLPTGFNPVNLVNQYRITCRWPHILKFEIYDTASERFLPFHTFDYVLFSAPNFYIQRGLYSFGSTTPAAITLTGISGGHSGENYAAIPTYSTSITKNSIASGSDVLMLAMQNRLVINGYANQSEVFLQGLTMFVDGTKPCTLRIWKNPTLIGTGLISNFNSWSYHDAANSLMKIDTGASSQTGGRVIREFTLPKSGSFSYNFIDDGIFISREQTLTFTVQSAAASDVSLSVSWTEDL